MQLTNEVKITALRTAEVADQSLVDAQWSFAQGRKSFRGREPAEAVEFYNEPLLIGRPPRILTASLVTQYAVSQAYRNFGNRQKTEECLSETLRILNLQMAPNDWRVKASAWNDLGPIYAVLDRRRDR